ncbi:unnamed protein product [Allacma fusca]|uniref:C2H2-type domain-containing protein n=1 Tax=Allacma fusca TaxID=39272 RepID=A0A8J2Q6U0_9HEXA|nr:unnamed protein product [Allacma fusca]
MSQSKNASLPSFKLVDKRNTQKLNFERPQQLSFTFNSQLPIFIPGVAEISRLMPSLLYYPSKYGVPSLRPIIAPTKSMPKEPKKKQVRLRDVIAEAQERKERARPAVTSSGIRSSVLDNASQPSSVRIDPNNRKGKKGQEKAIASSSAISNVKPVQHCNCSKCARKNVKYGPHRGDDDNSSRILAGPPKHGKFPCPKCGKEFASARGLKHHQTFYTVNKSKSACFFCHRVFESSFSLNKHLFQQHMSTLSQMYRCYYCNHTFLSQSLLDNHVLRHLSG